MAYGDSTDPKRSEQFNPSSPRRLSISDPQPDFKAPGLTALRARHSIFSVLRRLINASVLTPAFAGLVVGLALIVLFPADAVEPSATGYVESAAFIGRGLVVGSAVTGLFAWTQGMSAEKQKRDDLRVQIGFAGDLGRADLVDLEVSDVFVRGRKLSGARLSRARLHHGDFSGAELSDTRMTNGSFFKSTFDQAVMIAVGAYSADFHGCSFVGTNFNRAILCKADLRFSDIDRADFTDADLRDANLLTVQNIETATFERTWFSSGTQWPELFDPVAHGGLVEKSSTHRERMDEVIDLRSVVSESVG